MSTGRPLKFATPELLQEKIDAYFASCSDESGKLLKPYTITGLALALDTTRETLCDYQEKDDFSDTVIRAKLRCENFAEEQIFVSRNPNGAIFALKNYGWKDSHDFTSAGKSVDDLKSIDARLSQLLGKIGGIGAS